MIPLWRIVITAVSFVVPIGGGQTVQAHSFTDARIVVAIAHAFPTDVAYMENVVWCESHRQPKAINARSGDRGLVQVQNDAAHRDLVTRMGFTWDDMLRVEPNLAVGHVLYYGDKGLGVAPQRRGGWKC